MKLYIRQKIFSFRDRFAVKDAFGEDRYYVEGELFSWGKKLHVYNRGGQEVAFIQQKVFSWMPKYFVYVNGRQVGEIVKEFTFFFPKYRVDGLNWSVEGSFWAHDYKISDGNRPVVTIHKEWMTWGDCYELDIYPGENELVALAVVLAIDCCLEQAAKSNN